MATSSTGSALVASPSGSGSLLWSRVIANNQYVRVVGAQLSREVAEFERSMDWRESRSYTEAKHAFEQSFVEVTAAQAQQAAKAKKRWLQKLGHGWQKFCDTASHYQTIFDVLNNQAPEYSTAVWGSIKLLLLVSVNSSKLKKGVVENLDRVGTMFGRMEVLVEVQPTESMVEAVTAVYADSMEFLLEALRYYTENRAVAAYKKLLKPWEIRFQQLVQKIDLDVHKVQELMQIGNAIDTRKILQFSSNLVEGQDALIQRQDEMVRNQIHYSEAHSKMLQTVTGALQSLHARDTQHSMFRQIECQLDALITTVASEVQAARQYKPVSYYDLGDDPKIESYVSCYIHPKDTFVEFVRSIWPLVDVTGRSLIRSIEQYSVSHLFNSDRSLLRSISHADAKDISSWIDKTTSELLFIGSIKESRAQTWSADMCLEIIGASSKFDAVTVLYFLTPVEDQPSLEALVQTLIYQIIDRHKSSFSTIACRQQSITEQRFRSATANIYELLELLNDCLRVAEPLFLYVIIDSLELISIRAGESADGGVKIEYLMEHLQNLCSRDETVSKVLITSTSVQDKDYLASPFKSSQDSSRLKIVQLARGTHHDSIQNVGLKPHVRLPYEPKSGHMRLADPAILLKLDDLGLDADEEQKQNDTEKDSDTDEFEWNYSVGKAEDTATKYLTINSDNGLSTTSLLSSNETASTWDKISKDSKRDLEEHSFTGSQPESVAESRSIDAHFEREESEDWESDDSIFKLIPKKTDQKKDRPAEVKDELVSGAEKYLQSDSE